MKAGGPVQSTPQLSGRPQGQETKGNEMKRGPARALHSAVDDLAKPRNGTPEGGGTLRSTPRLGGRASSSARHHSSTGNWQCQADQRDLAKPENERNKWKRGRALVTALHGAVDDLAKPGSTLLTVGDVAEPGKSGNPVTRGPAPVTSTPQRSGRPGKPGNEGRGALGKQSTAHWAT
jgi:uncharacterized cupin superfamily protein